MMLSTGDRIRAHNIAEQAAYDWKNRRRRRGESSGDFRTGHVTFVPQAELDLARSVAEQVFEALQEDHVDARRTGSEPRQP